MTDSAPAYRCATAALQRGDALAGSAPPARQWLLLEHPGPWRVDAIPDSGIDQAVLADLVAAAGRTSTRVLLVRRSGRPAQVQSRRWFLVSQSRRLAGRWEKDEDLRAAVAALDGAERPDHEFAVESASMLLVCAHGVHDACCAIRGRPVAAALAEQWPDAVWECTHVGGDRFAPNVLVLPDGYYYGQLDPESAVAVISSHLAGAVVARFVRGMSPYAPPVQAAVIEAHHRLGPLGPADVTVIRARPLGKPDEHPATTVVELAVGGVAVAERAVVHAVRRPPAQLTCRAAHETPATEYRVTWSAAGLTD